MADKMTPAEFLTTLNTARVRYPRAVADRKSEEDYHARNGHRTRYCIHGTDQWTDYDNICGGCEDGVTLLAMVVEGAYSDVMEYKRRIHVAGAAIGTAAREGMPLDQAPLWEWVKGPLTDLS